MVYTRRSHSQVPPTWPWNEAIYEQESMLFGMRIQEYHIEQKAEANVTVEQKGRHKSPYLWCKNETKVKGHQSGVQCVCMHVSLVLTQIHIYYHPLVSPINNILPVQAF